MRVQQLSDLNERIMACRQCRRLVSWREEVARIKVKRYVGDPYWGRPVPGFGDPSADIVVVGLAPAAHGANRTGRMFTGDSSGDWLIEALYRNGLANQSQSRSVDDGLQLFNTYVTAAVRCAPPENKPRPEEGRACAPFLAEEFQIFRPKVMVALGRFAFDAVKRALKAQGNDVSPWTFAHGSRHQLPRGLLLMASYHPSRQNTQTGKLTRDMLDVIFADARRQAESG